MSSRRNFLLGGASLAAILAIAPAALATGPSYLDLVVDAGCVPGIGVAPAVAAANLTKIQAALNTAAAAGQIVTAPAGCVIEHNACVRPPSNSRIEGWFTFRLANAQNATQWCINGPLTSARISNVSMVGVTFDANAQGQTVSNYPLAMWNFSNVRIEDFTVLDFWATAVNCNDLDNEGSGPGGAAPAPYGWQTSDTLVMKNVKTVRSGANLTFANSNPTMWQGDQFVIGKVYDVLVQGIKLAHGGQNGLGLQMLLRFRIEDYEGEAFARGLYLETCRDGVITSPRITGHRSINNDPYNFGDTFGIWVADASQSYTAINYASCYNLVFIDPIVHNFSRPYTPTGRFRAFCVSGKTGYPATNIDVVGGELVDMNQNSSNAQKCIALDLQGAIVNFKGNPLIAGIDGAATGSEAYGSSPASWTNVSIT